MNKPTFEVNSNELYHYGRLGMKWGQHIYVDEHGNITNAAKEKYRTNRVIGNIARASTNSVVGQRLWGVGINKGYRTDKRAIKAKYKALRSTTNGRANRKSLKNDYKKTLAEARTTAANVLYPWQSKQTNKKIQSQHLGKSMAKAFVLGNYGALNYDRLVSAGHNKGTAAAVGFVSGLADNAAYGIVAPIDYAHNALSYERKNMRK